MTGSGVTPITGSPGGFGFYDDYVFMISSASANSVTATISEGAALAITT